MWVKPTKARRVASPAYSFRSSSSDPAWCCAMLLAVGAVLGFAPASPFSRSAVRPSRAAPLMATPLDAVAGPLNKWAPAAAAAGGSPLDDLPLEVKALFAIIPIVGVLGLLKSNGMLGTDAPTLGLGETREDLGPEAAVPPSWSKAALALARAATHHPRDWPACPRPISGRMESPRLVDSQERLRWPSGACPESPITLLTLPLALAIQAAAEKEANMTDGEREKMYFQQINDENKKKRGGSKSARKKK